MTNDELVIEGELLDPGMQAPYPGDTFTVSIMRYEVQRVLRGSYAFPVILVGHALADLNSPTFQVGVRHRLTLTSVFPEYATLLNPFAAEAFQIGVYYCPSFEVIK